VAGETKGRCRVGKVNVEANPNISARYNILSVPSLFFFDGGQLRESLSGSLPKHELMSKLKAYM